MSDAELEAITERATLGIVTYRLWIMLTPEERRRVGQLRDEDAKEILVDRSRWLRYLQDAAKEDAKET